MRYYENPVRAAEESRQGKAMSRYRYDMIVDGRKVQAQIIYHRGQYYMTYAGLPNTMIRFSNPKPFLDRCREWKPM